VSRVRGERVESGVRVTGRRVRGESYNSRGVRVTTPGFRLWGVNRDKCMRDLRTTTSQKFQAFLKRGRI